MIIMCEKYKECDCNNKRFKLEEVEIIDGATGESRFVEVITDTNVGYSYENLIDIVTLLNYFEAKTTLLHNKLLSISLNDGDNV